ncbi:MAG: TlpA family protein disulfide reductase [Oscillospiraceae bacterium]|nr:TlpA family protein disulfide reductase [Oscillospiraceae bacterium]
MNKKYSGILIMVLCFALLLAGAGLLYGKLGDSLGSQLLAENPQEQAAVPESDGTQAEDAEEIDYTAPDITVYDEEGNAVSLSDFEGTPVVLNFWASWCGPCKGEMPDFNQVYLEYDGTVDVEFMMVNLTDGMQETKEKAMKFVEEGEFAFPVYYDTDMDGMRTYGVQAVPVTYFINAEGDLVTYAKGAIDAETLKKGIEICMTTVIE